MLVEKAEIDYLSYQYSLRTDVSENNFYHWLLKRQSLGGGGVVG